MQGRSYNLELTIDSATLTRACRRRPDRSCLVLSAVLLWTAAVYGRYKRGIPWA